MAAGAKWSTDAFRRQFKGGLVRGMAAGGAYLAGQVKIKINISNRDGDNPSKPGEPPHKVTGNLQKSIDFDVEERGDAVILRVGSNIEYAKELELGTSGDGGKGKAARPYLRPTLLEKFETFKRVVTAQVRKDG